MATAFLFVSGGTNGAEAVFYKTDLEEGVSSLGNPVRGARVTSDGLTQAVGGFTIALVIAVLIKYIFYD